MCCAHVLVLVQFGMVERSVLGITEELQKVVRLTRGRDMLVRLAVFLVSFVAAIPMATKVHKCT